MSHIRTRACVDAKVNIYVPVEYLQDVTKLR